MIVVPLEIRAAIAEHARAELPNESCGIVYLRDEVAERFAPARNALASPYRFELDVELELLLVDEALTVAVVHSHPSTEPRPSSSDAELVGQWAGRPYLIYSVTRDELAAWRYVDGAFEPLPMREGAAA